MPPRLIAVAALVTLMCAVAVAQVPAAGGAPVCLGVDRNVVNACFKTFGEGMKNTIADRIISAGNVIKVPLDCCVTFGGHSCLCQMKNAWKAQGKSAQDNVQCVRKKAC
uniref:Uncharacterized protein n=1 Tax=Aegilops tauschii TaxID=37682 RepID=N1QXU6_AEGTA